MAQIVEKTTDQQHVEADIEGFERGFGPFVVAAEATRMPLAFTDAKTGLAQELDGAVDLDYADAGVICRIVMPLHKARGA